MFNVAQAQWMRARLSSGRRPLPMPVLQLWGERDAFLGKELTRGQAALCADYTERFFPNSGHWLQQDGDVNEVMAAMAAWLRVGHVAATPVRSKL